MSAKLNLAATAIGFDAVDPAMLAHFWSGVTGYHRAVTEIDYVRLEGEDLGVSALVFREVESWKKVPNRVALELVTDDLGAELARLIHLGARPVCQIELCGEVRMVLRDPEGNEFALVEPAVMQTPAQRLRRAA